MKQVINSTVSKFSFLEEKVTVENNCCGKKKECCEKYKHKGKNCKKCPRI